MYKNKIYWIGDSTVKHNRIDTYPQTGIGQTLNLYLKPNAEICNYAENGESSKSFYDEGHFKPIEASIKEGDYLFIQFGHNDNKEDKERFTEPYGSFIDYLSIYIHTAIRKGALPVLITPLSRRLFSDDQRFLDGSHGEYPTAIRSLANAENTALIDLTSKSADLLAMTGDIRSRKWFMHLLPEEYKLEEYKNGLADNTHLRYEGAVIMAGLIAEGLSELGEPFSSLLAPNWCQII